MRSKLTPARFGSDFGRLLSALETSLPAGLSGERHNVRARPPAAIANSAGSAASRKAWPNPDSIKNIKDYKTVLRRTWNRAGAPSHEEVERLTGRLVSRSTASSFLGSYSDYHSWTKDDFASTLLMLDALGVPDLLVRRWRKAGPRANRRDYIGSWCTTLLLMVLLAVVVGSGVGLVMSDLRTPPALGTGDWWALVVSCLIVAAGLFASAIGVSIAFYSRSNPGPGQLVRTFFICSVASFLIGWLKLDHDVITAYAGVRAGIGQHVNLAEYVDGRARIGADIRNWLVWRF